MRNRWHRQVRAAVLALTVVLRMQGGLLIAADWPQWRGPHRDGHALEPFPSALPTAPTPLWKHSLRHGYASPVVVSNGVVVMDEADGEETVLLLNPATGATLWVASIGPVFTDEFEPGPRCTPVVDGDRVYVQSALGEFRCLDLADGSVRWRFHFGDYGMRWVTDRASNIGAASRRGNTGSPVIDGDRILVQVGSTNAASIVAFDKRSGRELWKSQNDLTCFSSPVVGKLAGRPHFVTATCEGLLALDPADGTLLWRVPFKTGANRNVLTPVLTEDTVVFASHTTGLRATRIRATDTGVTADETWLNREVRINLSTPVVVGEHVYGLGARKDFICVHRDSGALAWSQPGFGDVTSTLASGNRLLLLTDFGELCLLVADPAKYQELGRFQACGKTYSHPAYADGVLYVRDPRELKAYRLAPSTR